ncbi:MAG: HAD hydrolase family protein [Rikenellaceae bacterium]
MENFKEKLARVKGFIFDVDGVLTNGCLTPTMDGDFIRQYYAKDGYAVAYAIQQGYQVCVITGGRGVSLKLRMEALKIRHVFIDCVDKVAAMELFFQRSGLTSDEVVYMGDDIPDLACMSRVGLPVAPADAASEILDVAEYVSQFKGGKGCVRDIIEQTLRSQDRWAKHTQGVTQSDIASR